MIVNLAAVPLHLPKLEDEQQGALHLQLLELWPAPQTFSTRACRKGQGSRLSAPACPCRRASTSRSAGRLVPPAPSEVSRSWYRAIAAAPVTHSGTGKPGARVGPPPCVDALGKLPAYLRWSPAPTHQSSPEASQHHRMTTTIHGSAKLLTEVQAITKIRPPRF